jgi:delta24-sterol reductase
MVEETQRQARRTDYENVQFVETLAFSATSGVVMTGRLVDKPDHSKGTVNRIGRWHKPWFYEHVESFLSLPSQPSTPTTESGTPATITEYIPLRHYYHRHSRSIFWELRDIIPLSSPSTSLLSTVFRWTLGWLCPPKISLLKLTTTGKLQVLYTEKHVVQDMLVPIKDLGESLDVRPF